MQLSIDLTMQIISMLLMVITGFLLNRFHIVTTKEGRILSQVCVYAFIPCMLFNSFQYELNASQLSGMALALVASLAVQFALILIARLLRKTPMAMTPEEEASTIYCNAGSFVLPMIYSIASLGKGYILYTAIFLMVQNTLMWSHGTMLISHEKKFNWKKIILNPCIISIFLGLTFFLLQIQLPGPVTTAMNNFAGCVGPVSMIVIGILLGEQDMKAVLSNLRIYFVVALRLIVFPLIGITVFWILSKVWIHNDLNNILMAIFLCTLGPAPNTITQIALMYKRPSTAYVSTINVTSVIFCAITMPIMSAIFLFVLSL